MGTLTKLNMTKSTGEQLSAPEFTTVTNKIDALVDAVNSLNANAIPPLTLQDAGNVSWDYSTANSTSLTLGGNRTLLLSNVPTNTTVMGVLRVFQDATGGRTLTLPGLVRPNLLSEFNTDPNGETILVFTSFPGASGAGNTYYWSAEKYVTTATATPVTGAGTTIAANYAQAMSAAGEGISSQVQSDCATFINEISQVMTPKEIFFLRGASDAGRKVGAYGTNLSWFGAWQHRATGSVIVDNNCAADTQLIPAQHLDVNSFSVHVYQRTALTTDADLAGCSQNATQRFRLLIGSQNGSVAVASMCNNATRVNASTANTRGLFSAVRSSSSRADLYQNATSVGNSTSTDNGSMPTTKLRLGGMQNSESGATDNIAVGSEFGLVLIGSGYAPGSHSVISTAVNKLMTAWGRNV